MTTYSSHYLRPDWPAPANIQAYTTLRSDGHSQGPYNCFNMSLMVGDDSDAVNKNRAQLCTELKLQHEPVWLNQQHGVNVLQADKVMGEFPAADASYTSLVGLPCVVLTADCMPLLLCNRQGSQVAAIHAGWRGLSAGVIEATLQALHKPGEDWLAWLGPTIGYDVFEVGAEVRQAFIDADPQAKLAFKPSAMGRFLADLYQLARQRLLQYGVTQIYGGQYCTYSDAERFYSYRRDGKQSGRMASLIWIQEDGSEQSPPFSKGGTVSANSYY